MNVLADFTIRVNEKHLALRELSDELLEKGKLLGKELGKTAKAGIAKTKENVKSTIKKSEEKIQPVFDDLKDMSNTNIKKLVKELDAQDLIIALKEANDELREKVIPNLNSKTKKAIEEAGRNAETATRQQIKKVRTAIEGKMRELFG
jgi:flagellar motor switch protein FliG